MDSPVVKSVTRVPEAEQAVVGITLAVPGAIAITRDLAPADFAEPEYSAIWSAIVELDSAGQPVDLAAVAGRLGTQGGADVAGSPAHLEELALGVPTTNLDLLPAYVKCVRDAALRRATIAEAQALQRLVLQPGDLDDALDRHEQRLEALRGKAKAAAPLFNVVPIDDLDHVEIEEQAYWWDGYVPAGVVTLLSAHGSTGKSYLSILLGVSIALGLPMFGRPTRQGRVAFFSGEDGAKTLRKRLQHVCRCLGVKAADLAGELFILDATTVDPTLFHEVGVGNQRSGLTTPAYRALREFIERQDIDVLIIDNSSDTFDANEIDRARVRGFMRSLTAIAQERNGAVLLLGHVNKTTSSGNREGRGRSESYSGSTAWHNSARSRLYLERDSEGNGLVLTHEKNNLGRLQDPLRLMWPDGDIPKVEYVPNGFVQGIKDHTELRTVLKLMHGAYSRQEWIATDPRSRYHAHNVLKDEPGFPKLKPADVFRLLRRAEADTLIEREVYRDGNRKQHERWTLTAKGRDYIGTAPSAPCAPSTDVGALRHQAQNMGAPSAPCSALGGVGEIERAHGAAS